VGQVAAEIARAAGNQQERTSSLGGRRRWRLVAAQAVNPLHLDPFERGLGGCLGGELLAGTGALPIRLAAIDTWIVNSLA